MIPQSFIVRQTLAAVRADPAGRRHRRRPTGRERVQKLNSGRRADRLSVRSAKNTGGAAKEHDMPEDQPTAIHTSVTGDPTGGAVSLLAVVAILLGIQLTGAVPAASAGLFVPVLLLAGTAMLLLGLQAVRKGDNIVGLFFSTFGPFVVAFGLLIIGLEHGWWGIPLADVPHAEGAFLLAWTIILTVWFFLSFVLPTIFTLLLTFVDIALWSLVIGIWNTSSGPQKVAGWMLFVTGAGALYFGAALWLRWVGFAELPIGRPLLHRREHGPALAQSPAAPVSSAG
jgi:succinate-acetate transporter protein